MSQIESDPANCSVKDAAVLVTNRPGLLIFLCISSLLNAFTTITFAQERQDTSTEHHVAALHAGGVEAFDPAVLPSLASIDAHTDISAFLQKGVPEELRRSALRRAWSVDPLIRDFRGLEENAWNFNDPDSIPGFGELGPEFNIRYMLANLFSEPSRSPVRVTVRPYGLYSYLFAAGRGDARELAHE